MDEQVDDGTEHAINACMYSDFVTPSRDWEKGGREKKKATANRR
jgi:hypothetical protein